MMNINKFVLEYMIPIRELIKCDIGYEFEQFGADRIESNAFIKCI